MRRREVTGLLGAVLVWPLAAQSQPKLWRIGVLVGGKRPQAIERTPGGLLEGLKELGYVEGRDVVLEWRFAESRYERFPALAAELVHLKVDVIVTSMGLAVRSLQEATKDIPIVIGFANDPVAAGFVTSLAHPGGNITGLSSAGTETLVKQLD